MYCVGDWVSYPMHGAGVIEAIEDRETHGRLHRYYALRFSVSGMKVLIPVESAEEVGLRSIIPSDDLPMILRCLDEDETLPEESWNRRYRDNLEKMRSGDLGAVAGVVRSLTLRGDGKGLSAGEKKMLSSARKILISELTLACGKTPAQLSEQIDTVIRRRSACPAEETDLVGGTL